MNIGLQFMDGYAKLMVNDDSWKLNMLACAPQVVTNDAYSMPYNRGAAFYVAEEV